MRFLLLLTLIYTNNVSSYDAFVKYNFNHSPAVVNNPHKSKAVHKENTSYKVKNNNDGIMEPVETTTEEYEIPSTREETVILAENNSLKIKETIIKQDEIPVVVVYDSEIDNTSNKKNFSVSEISKPSRRRLIKQIRHPVPKSINIEEINTNLPTINEPNPENTVPDKVNTQHNPSRKKPEMKARTRERDPVVPILESENYVYSHNGNFHYSYESGDGTKAFSQGSLKKIYEDGAGEAVIGGFSYKDKDGNDFSLTYTADENGYRPVGAHLPTPPPPPPHVARTLALLATATSPQPVTKPSP